MLEMCNRQFSHVCYVRIVFNFFQSCENEQHNPDLEGLHESIVDGSDDEDYITDSIDVSTIQIFCFIEI